MNEIKIKMCHLHFSMKKGYYFKTNKKSTYIIKNKEKTTWVKRTR